jgi:hypothetical protein
MLLPRSDRFLADLERIAEKGIGASEIIVVIDVEALADLIHAGLEEREP